MAFVVGATAALALGVVPWWLLALYGVMSIVCFIAYAADKRAARLERRRVPERTLLDLGLVCGWPGAIVAQQVLRHKTVKQSFRSAFWRTVVVNLALVTFLVSPLATMALDNVLELTGITDRAL
ncbi:uncharacterized membrane protein YsdA (DUF1294 family) [Sanguibacter antarcticus]|uniref:Uncharacterized membrane protein YsdA (DUF1294 family) n=1 Tax=Sanguibacter antarcticus TaxID=372484 RepID=A0A2A9E2N0_9MICO|nr:uncharacterized membrane protein YsdA (DUF1294 family) [Sanguibacter antarcticus]